MDDSFSRDFIEPSNTSSYGLFPTATVADHDQGGNPHYYIASSDGFDHLGIVTTWDTLLFDDPYRRISYPFSYGSLSEDDFHLIAHGLIANHVTEGHIVHIADGTGSLTLPFGTVTNVLRVHSTSTSTTIMDGDTTTESQEWYAFYKPGVHWSVYQGAVDGSWANWLDEYSIGMAEALLLPIGMDLYPNPASEEVEVVYSSTTPQMRFQVFDASGHLVVERSVSNVLGIARHRIDLKELESGLYSLRITDGAGASSARRLVLQ